MGFNKNFTEQDETISKSRDKKVTFDPISHTYKYDDMFLTSVTQFIKKHTKPFNPLFPSISKSKKNASDNTGITDPKLLRKYWRLNAERSSCIGTATHVFTEMYLLDRNTLAKTKYEEAAIKAIKKIEKIWVIESQEDIVYNTNYLLAGSRDLKLKHKDTKEIWVGDWKVTEDMFKSYNKLLSPFNTLKDSAINKYSIQLDLYSILDDKYIPEKNRLVIQLKKDGSFQLYFPDHPDKKYKLPYTLDKTKKAIKKYVKENKPVNKD